MSKRILVILGHSDEASLCAAMAKTYIEAAQESGAEVRQLFLGEMSFDPILAAGYRGQQDLEPDLIAAQAQILWAEHLVWVYPVWWGGLPALLKGFIDRVFLPGFAFKYRKDSAFWDKLLQGRSARLLVNLDTPAWYFRWINGRPAHNQMKKTILEFCGITPVALSAFGPVRGSSLNRRESWLQQVRQLGRQLK